MAAGASRDRINKSCLFYLVVPVVVPGLERVKAVVACFYFQGKS